MPILTAEQAREEFKSVLNVVAAAAMFQYTFVLAIIFIFTSIASTAPEFAGLGVSRSTWGLIAPLGASVLNLYVGRNLGYLAKLVRMHPRERRALRFLARHHPWLLNPYRVLCGPRSGMHPSVGSALYTVVVVSAQFPATMLYDTEFRDAWKWLITYPLFVVLMTSYAYLALRVFALGNALWRGRYAPEPTPLRQEDTRTALTDLFPNRGFIAVKHSRSTERNPTSHSSS
jgi:hypothetical protein